MQYTKGQIKVFIVLSLLFCAGGKARAEEVYLKNGDRVTGIIIEDAKGFIVISTEGMGEVRVSKDFIRDEALVGESPEIIWGRKISVGYNKSSGNTDSSRLISSFLINRNRVHIDEITLEGDIYYSSSDEKMDAQKWNGSGRYAFSFGSQEKWYSFYKIGAGHDRFANIDYRVLPSLGLGYWFFDTASVKAMAEAAIGYEHTDYRDSTDNDNETVLVPRVFLEKVIFGDTRIRQDVFFYPAVSDFSDYRLHSETVFSNPLDDRLSLDVSLIEDYNSEPSTNVKKNDIRLLTSLTYSF
ncbi:MAG: DUF481 domain-containing protein [Planctomycetota bacterium]|jgi:putative salt-induced outer membrane protein YdiY